MGLQAGFGPGGWFNGGGVNIGFGLDFGGKVNALANFSLEAGKWAWQGAGYITAAGGGLWASNQDWSAPERNTQKAIYNAQVSAANAEVEDYFLFYNGQTLSVMQHNNVIYSTGASSGKGEHMNNPNSQKVSDLGPIPEGNYFLYNNQWKHQSKVRQVYNIIAGNGDWGDYNVPLNYISWKEPRTLRYGFYLHGGFWPGSAGCIDAGGGVGDVYNYIKKQYVTYLRVKY